MTKGRLEAFSDGMFSIIITIMVLELAVPAGSQWSDLFTSQHLTALVAYLISYVLVTSFWVSHHNIVVHMRTVTPIDLWHNALVLLPISLLPLMTEWFDRYPMAAAPSVAYAILYIVTVMALYTLAARVARQMRPGYQRDDFVRVNRHRLVFMAAGVVDIGLANFWPPITWVMVALISGSWITMLLVRATRNTSHKEDQS
ncbi:TMEM175 family protein [Lacticaseibacillus thailandensis]|nr:TMEM175 family protein [Lacticaseibacillus thailandensis]